MNKKEKKQKYINIIKQWIDFKSKHYEEIDSAVNDFMLAYLHDKGDRNDFDRIEIYQIFQFGYVLGIIKTIEENNEEK